MSRLPFLRHPLSFAGGMLASIGATLFLVFFVAQSMGFQTNPYIGMVFVFILPAIFLAGLALIPVGMWRQRRRLAAGKGDVHWPILNLNSAAHRQVTAMVAVLTMMNIIIVSLVSYSGLEYMDSSEFCGSVCHEVMEPEHLAFQAGSHANVGCVACHIGPGASWFVQAKLAGTRQVVSLGLNSFSRPIPTPVHNLRPARETCGQCHWPERFRGDKIKVIRDYGDDEANTVSETTLQLHIGGGSERGRTASGIHWHTSSSNTLEYIATDESRAVIPWVRVTAANGTVRDYVADGASVDTLMSSGTRRRFDCVDCHNRVGHPFASTPERAISAALSSGEIPADLPYVRREALAALTATYDSKAAALDAIAASLRGFYDTGPYADRRLDVDRAITATQGLYQRNVFPSMKVGFGTYASHLGHTDFPGCFRCHDDEHRAPDGRVISQSCDLCHDFR